MFRAEVAPWLLAAALVGCSGASDDESLPPVTAPAPVTAPVVAGPDPDEVAEIEASPFGLPDAVEVAVRVSPARSTTLVSMTPRSVDPSTLDPFDSVASCSVVEGSGTRPFEVVVADRESESSVRFASADSEVLEEEAASVEVDVEVRLLGGPVRLGTGRVTFVRVDGAIDQRSGTVVGRTDSGESVSAGFTCSGERTLGDRSMAPGYSVRLRDGLRERTASMAMTDDDAMRCADPVDADRVVVSVATESGVPGGGGGSLAVSSRPGLATGASAPADVVLSVLGRTLVLGEATVTLTGAGTGIFSGTSSDGVVVDGAWRCPG